MLVIRQLNELAQWSENVSIFYKYVIIADMLHIMLWHGNCSNLEFKAAILPASALQQAFMWTTCHHLLEKSKNSMTGKEKKKKKGLCTVPYIFAYLKKNKKQKLVQFTTS